MADAVAAQVDELTDERLMLLAGAGDREAFGELVERHHPRALDLAYRLCGDADLAQDVVQESFLRILRAAHRYEVRARFSTYLFAVVRNQVRESARTRQRRRESPLESHETPGGDPTMLRVPHSLADPVTPEVETQRRELGRRLLAALDALPEALRAVFVLSEMEGVAYRDIAEICACPMGTVASRKHAAISRLREILGPLRGEA